MRRTRIRTFVLSLIVSLCATATGAIRMPANAEDAPLDGRLGGSFRSFEAAYGTAGTASEGSGNTFTIDGFGSVLVQFNRTGGPPRPDDPALVITLSSPRPVDVAAQQPSDADWEIQTAIGHARDFLPRDVALADPRPAEPGRATAACRSQALEDRFGVLSLGQCVATFIQPTARTVSFVILSLSGPADVPGDAATATAGGDCGGLVQWSQATGSRLDGARTLLQGASTLDPAAADTVGRLRELAGKLEELAAAQRAEPAPAAAATASYYVISALNGYAQAVRAAADATAARDAAAMDDAVARIGEANAAVATATEEIRSAVERCGLVAGTPAAGATASAAP